MGCLYGTAAGAAVLAIVLALSGSPLQPVTWDQPGPLPHLNGTLTANTDLSAAEHLHVGKVLAPESFAIGPDGTLYASLGTGSVVALDENGENPVTVFFTGGYISEQGQKIGTKNGVEYDPPLLKECQAEGVAGRLHLSPEMEERCGRPLGLRFQGRSTLYILDAYHGLFTLDIKTGQAKHLFNALSSLPLPLPTKSTGSLEEQAAEKLDPVVTARARFLNDLAVTAKGVVYFTDSSHKNCRSKNRPEILDGAPRGRLLRYDPRSGEVRTVLCGLHFPNGVELDPSGNKLLVVESMRFRILELALQDIKDSHSSLVDALHSCKESPALPSVVKIFAKDLPGFADNIRYDKETKTYLAGLGTKVSQPFSLLHALFLKPRALRVILGYVLPMRWVDMLVPKYGLLLRLDADGQVVRSYHDPSGRTPFVSEAETHPKSGWTFLGSHSNRFLARLKLPE